MMLSNGRKKVALILIGTLIFVHFLSANQYVRAGSIAEDGFDFGGGNDDFYHGAYITDTTFMNLCQADEDWYNFSLDLSQTLIVTIYCEPGHNLRITLYDRYYNFLNQSGTGGAMESCSASSGAMMQNISIRITGDNMYEKYDMGINVYDSMKTDDSFDNDFFNQNDNLFTAAWFGIPTYPQSASLKDLKMWDNDWYKFNCTQEFYYSFALDRPFGEYGFGLELYDNHHNLLRSGFSFNQTRVNMDWTANFTGYAYLLVKFNGFQNGLNYNFSVQQIGIMCNSDDKEENDDYNSARMMSVPTFVTLSICSNDPDFFKFDVPSGNSLKIIVNASERHNFNVAYMESENNVYFSAQSNNGQANLTIEVDSGDSSSSSKTAKSAASTTVVIRINANENFTYTMNVTYDIAIDLSNDDYAFAEIPGYPAPIFLGLSSIMVMGIILHSRKRKPAQ